MEELPARFGAWQCLGGYRSIAWPEQRLHHLHIARIRPLTAPRRRTPKLLSIAPNTLLIEGFSGLRGINRTCWRNLTLGSGICFYLCWHYSASIEVESQEMSSKTSRIYPILVSYESLALSSGFTVIWRPETLEFLGTVCCKVLILSKTTNILLSAYECLRIGTKASLNDTLLYLELEVCVSLT